MERKKRGISLIQAVTRSIALPVIESRRIRATFCQAFGTRPSMRINRALSAMTSTDQILFLKRFLELWYRNDEPSQRQVTNLLSENGPVIGTQLMFTLSGDQKQLRCWHRPFGRIKRHDVHDCDDGSCLFTVRGAPVDIAAITNELAHGRMEFVEEKTGTLILAGWKR